MVAALAFIFSFSGTTSCYQKESISEQVGVTGENRTVLPVNQILEPSGTQIFLPGLRPQALALSPNGQILAVSGKTNELIIIDLKTEKIVQSVDFPSKEQTQPLPESSSDNILNPDQRGQLSYTGLIFSENGASIYLSRVF